MKTRLMICAAALSLGLAACGGSEDTETADTGMADSTAMADATPTNAPAPMAGTPQEFVDMAASSDMYELEAARLAQQNGTAQPVKDFAAMMLTDHGNSSAKLKQAAQGMNLTVPTAMMPAHQAQLDELKAASGDQFDAVYARQQVAAHEQALALMRAMAQQGTATAGATGAAAGGETGAATGGASGGAGALAAFAAETAPVIEGHLERARALPGG